MEGVRGGFCNNLPFVCLEVIPNWLGGKCSGGQRVCSTHPLMPHEFDRFAPARANELNNEINAHTRFAFADMAAAKKKDGMRTA